ncbi:MAG TPA: MBL fold metallo-hydrolase [Clostridiales bacterium]|nr:MBL fold metallo-hydrolase [Clostridiales bacterium]
MLKMATLASGSSGNCAVVSDGRSHVLLDAGISARRITTGLRALEIDPKGLSGVLITHEHTDHVSGLAVLCRQLDVELYATEGTARQICWKNPELESRFRVFDPGERFGVAGLVVDTFATSHDCACPVGYAVGDGVRRMALCTDTGMVPRQAAECIRGVQLLVGEFNYDLEMLQMGAYPYHLKERIRGESGHLSNEMGAKLAAWAVEQGASRLVLAHLSKENNLPEKAHAAALKGLAQVGARVGDDVEVHIAPRDSVSCWLEV